MPGRVLSIAPATLAAITICSCGSSAAAPATPTPTSVPTPTASSLDPCLVGTWKSNAISASLTVGGAAVKLTGGAGEVLTIAATRIIRTDDSGTVPLTGTAVDGTAYKVAQTGTASGTITSAAGKITVKLDQPNTLSVVLYKNGVLVQSQSPGSASDSYMCTVGTSLIVTSAGGTMVKYSPA